MSHGQKSQMKGSYILVLMPETREISETMVCRILTVIYQDLSLSLYLYIYTYHIPGYHIPCWNPHVYVASFGPLKVGDLRAVRSEPRWSQIDEGWKNTFVTSEYS